MSFNSTGQITGSPVETGTFSISVRATNDLGSDTQIFTLTVNQLPVITTTSFGYARLGNPYSAQLTATGTTPITYAITNGGLPPGLSLSSNGLITGASTNSGIYQFTVVATNVAGSSSPVNLQIQSGVALGIITVSPLPSGTVGVSYNGKVTFQAAGIDTAFATS